MAHTLIITKTTLLTLTIIIIGGCAKLNLSESWRDREKAEEINNMNLLNQWRDSQKENRNKYAEEHPEIDEYTKECIRTGKIYKGMRLEDAKVAWNAYNWRQGLEDSEHYEVWNLHRVYYRYNDQGYSGILYTFSCKDGKVISWTKWGV